MLAASSGKGNRRFVGRLYLEPAKNEGDVDLLVVDGTFNEPGALHCNGGWKWRDWSTLETPGCGKRQHKLHFQIEDDGMRGVHGMAPSQIEHAHVALRLPAVALGGPGRCK